MTDIDRIRREVDDLLALNYEAGDEADVLEQAMAAYQRTLTLVEATHGANSSQARNLAESIKRWESNYESSYGLKSQIWPVIRGTLKGLQRDLDAGLLGSLELRGAGISLGDMLTLAKEALADTREGTDDVAAVLAGAAFEDTIRRMGETLAGVEGRPKLQKVIAALKKQDLLTGPAATLVQGHLQFRNDALHLNRDALQEELTAGCISFVEGLLMKHFS